MSISQRIFEYMDSHHLKYTDLADKLGINRSVVSTWKSRDKNPPSEYIVQICEFLNVSLSYLLTGKEAAGSDQTLTEGDREVLKLIKDLSEKDKYKIAGALEVLIRQMPSSGIAPLFVHDMRTQEAFSNASTKKK